MSIELVEQTEIESGSSSSKGKSGLSKEKKKEPTPTKGNWNHQRDKYREKVKGKFIFHEVPGGEMKFPFKAFKGDKLERYALRDGEIYVLPLGVARHLNKNCWYPEHHFLMDEDGKPSVRVGKKVRRCSFQSLEFVDIEDLTPDENRIYTVTGVK